MESLGPCGPRPIADEGLGDGATDLGPDVWVLARIGRRAQRVSVFISVGMAGAAAKEVKKMIAKQADFHWILAPLELVCWAKELK